MGVHYRTIRRRGEAGGEGVGIAGMPQKGGKICKKVIATEKPDDYYGRFGDRIKGYHSYRAGRKVHEMVLNGRVDSAAT
jgi:hypothetical protein